MQTQDTVAVLNAICGLVDKLGDWPLGLVFLFVIIGPWIFSFVLNRMQDKRFDAVTEMYKSNIRLVESFDAIAKGLLETIALNTATWQRAIDKIDMNQYCPLNRTVKQRMEDIG